MATARISLLSFREGASEGARVELVERVRQISALAAPVARGLVATDLPPNRNGGDIIWRLEFASEADYEALMASREWRQAEAALQADPALARAETFAFTPLSVGERGVERRGGLYRLLVLALEESTPPDLRARFETEMAAMPSYVSSIHRWNFARVTHSAGPQRWDYLWEQEYTDLAGFRGEYMSHPYHWGVVDIWYDPDNPARIVKPYLCNSFCDIDAPVMFTRWPRPAATPFPG